MLTIMQTDDSSSSGTALENIQFQLNHTLPPILIDCFETIIDNIDISKNNAKNMAHPAITKSFKILEDAVEKEIGIPIRHVTSSGTLYATVFASPVSNSVVRGNVETYFKALERFEKEAEDLKSKDDLISWEAQRDDVLAKVRHSYKVIEKTLNKSKLKIDRKEGKITGLPKDFLNFLLIDLVTLKKIGVTPRQCTGFLVHELGHMWSAIEYSVYTARTTLGIMDTIQEQVNKKGLKLADAINVAHAKISDDKIEDTDSIKTAFISLTNSIGKETVRLTTGSRYHSVDFEMLADQFASRFGLGKDVVTGLIVFSKYNTKTTSEALQTWFLVEFSLWTGLLGLLTGSIGVGLGIATIRVLFLGIATGSISVLRSLYTGNDNSSYATYDNAYHRIRRIRLEVIKSLKLSDLTKEKQKEIIDEIDFLDNILSKAKEFDGGILDKVIEMMFVSKRTARDLKEIDVLTENLLSNDLLAGAIKLKLI